MRPTPPGKRLTGRLSQRLLDRVASKNQSGALMKIAVVRRTLAVLAVALAGTQLASSQLPALLSQVAAPPPARTPAVAGEAERFRLKANVDLVVVEATVRDQYGAVVDDLTREDFRLYEDGVEQQISHFSRDELPLAVALVLDRSGSMDPVLKQLRRVAYDTLSSLKPDDQVALFDFAARAERLEDLTTDRRRIADDIATIHAAGATVITDALFETALYLGRAAPRRRHAIILVSDNENTLKGYSSESRVIRQALENREIRESYSISGVGFLRMEDRDSIPQAADFLLTEENVHTAIVYGIIVKGDREMVVGSMRTSKVTLNPDEFLKEALGATEAGRYYGGGRRGAGGFEIPIGFLASIKDDELVRMKWRLYDELIKRKLFAKIGVPATMRNDSSRDTGALPVNSLRVEEA